MFSQFNLCHLSQKKAQRLFYQAYDAQLANDFQEAVRLYQASIDVFPTAESHTFLGWVYSFMGELGLAIEHCEEAIVLDPEFGNPYNDIGAYLIALGKFEEAFPYLSKALITSRYRANHYAYFNLGRVYEHRGDLFNAYRQYRFAYHSEPTYAIALYALERIKLKMATGASGKVKSSKKVLIHQ